MTRSAIDRLAKEIQEGKSALTPMTEASALRLVLIAALRLERASDRRILVHVADVSPHVMQTFCKLPGVKQRKDEDFADAITRIMDQDLQVLASDVRFAARAEEVKCFQRSDTSAIQTMYDMMLQYGRLFVEDGPIGDGAETKTMPRALAGHLRSFRSLSSPMADHFNRGDIFAVDQCDRTRYYAFLEVEEFERANGALATPGTDSFRTSRISRTMAPEMESDFSI